MSMMADVNELMSELCVNDASIVVHVSFFSLRLKVTAKGRYKKWIQKFGYYLRRTDRTVR